jgi:hypothetical protein
MTYSLPHIPKVKNKVRGGTNWFERTFIQGDIKIEINASSYF